MAVSSVSSLLSHTLSIVYMLLVSYGSHQAWARTRFIRLCKNTHFDILTVRGVKIEPYERSRVELLLAGYTRPEHRRKFKLHFEFKTSSANGTLFYGYPGDRPGDLIALTLRNGRLRYIVQCPTAYVDIPAPTRGNRVNDNQWHSVNFYTRYNHHGDFSIDGVPLRKRYLVGCDNITSIVMGGHNPDPTHHRYDPELSLRHRYKDGERDTFSWHENHRWLAARHGHFEGCIRKVNLVHLLRAPPQYYAVSECE